MSELYIGLMSGTSVDAIDAVLMDFEQSNTHIITSHSQAISNSLRDDINTLIATQELPNNTENIDIPFAMASCEAVNQLLKQSAITSDQITAIGSHGQTVFHDPNGSSPVSVQIGNPQVIADTTKIPTIGNLRQADIEANGQGAPLACAYHAEVLQNSEEERVILNLGGIANITKLPKDKDQAIIGFDTGPANTLMDSWTQQHLHQPFDGNGTWAQTGKVDQTLLENMLKDNYFSAPPPKSTGRELFNREWLRHHLESFDNLAIEDVQATLLALTTRTIAESVNTWCPESKTVLTCGGGSENKQLNIELKGKSLKKTDDYGIPSNWMEAMAFAWLAKQHIDNKPGNIPSVTGAKQAVKLGELHTPQSIQ